MSEHENSAFEQLLATGGGDVKSTTIRTGNEADEALLQLIATADEFSGAGRKKLQEGEYGAAITLFWMSLAHERMVGSPFRLANDYGNMGTAYLLSGHLLEARAALDESLRLYAAANSAAGAAKTYYWLSQWEIREKNWERAQDFARKSVLLFEKHQHRFVGPARELLDWINAKVSAEQPQSSNDEKVRPENQHLR